MIKTLKYCSFAAALAFAPISASALGFFGDIGAGDTYNFSSGEQTMVAQAINPEAAGSFSFDVMNDRASTWTFNFGVPYLNNALPGGNFTFGPNINGASVNNATGVFSLALAAGETVTMTIFHDALVKGNRLGARFSAVPLPAGLVLLLSALGMTALVRRRSNGNATA